MKLLKKSALFRDTDLLSRAFFCTIWGHYKCPGKETGKKKKEKIKAATVRFVIKEVVSKCITLVHSKWQYF